MCTRTLCKITEIIIYIFEVGKRVFHETSQLRKLTNIVKCFANECIPYRFILYMYIYKRIYEFASNFS